MFGEHSIELSVAQGAVLSLPQYATVRGMLLLDLSAGDIDDTAVGTFPAFDSSCLRQYLQGMPGVGDGTINAFADLGYSMRGPWRCQQGR